MTDAELVERARAGDRTAFDKIVERYQHVVFRAVCAVAPDRAEAEDAAQETFIRAYRRLGEFRGDSSVKTWLLAIAWRQAISRRRSVISRMRRIVAHRDDVPFDPPAAGRSQEDGVITAERLAAVTAVVRRLPEKYRAALLLAATGDHTVEEMAAALDVPVGTLKWRVAEARRLLKMRLKASGYTG